eukprot:TRINITY_DN19610_c0_g1_i1.p1 TRINITY_DN19610_c0_g1~~TRINITY_DN19610_c0_g1_i1.p1  ORF type:complete len:333 (+),score=58.14 TRINITY_DN19610_c0_g1_i1:167-1165(+)
MTDAELGPCHVCSAMALALCSRCRTVAYCGPDCQRADWSTHKASCGKVLASPSPATSKSPPVQCNEQSNADKAAGPYCSAATRPSPSLNNPPTPPADFDVFLVGHRNVETAKAVVDVLKARGVCVMRAGADKTFLKALHMESRQLWDGGEFGEAQKGQPVVPGSSQIRYDARDDKVHWLSSKWMDANEKRARALKVLDGQLTDFGLGISKLLEDELGLAIGKRSAGMLACYDGKTVPGAQYGFHVDNPYQTQMDVPDDGRRLTLIYYITDGPWDVKKDGGGLQVCLSDPRKTPKTTREAMTHDRFTVSPEGDTLVVFFSHKMYHAVLPVTGT